MRCKCCNAPMVGAVRYKNIQVYGRCIEEDFCNQCIHETDYIDFLYNHTYQFEELTEDVVRSLNVEIHSEMY